MGDAWMRDMLGGVRVLSNECIQQDLLFKISDDTYVSGTSLTYGTRAYLSQAQQPSCSAKPIFCPGWICTF